MYGWPSRSTRVSKGSPSTSPPVTAVAEGLDAGDAAIGIQITELGGLAEVDAAPVVGAADGELVVVRPKPSRR